MLLRLPVLLLLQLHHHHHHHLSAVQMHLGPGVAFGQALYNSIYCTVVQYSTSSTSNSERLYDFSGTSLSHEPNSGKTPILGRVSPAGKVKLVPCLPSWGLNSIGLCRSLGPSAAGHVPYGNISSVCTHDTKKQAYENSIQVDQNHKI